MRDGQVNTVRLTSGVQNLNITLVLLEGAILQTHFN
jgi:hypothetical protein